MLLKLRPRFSIAFLMVAILTSALLTRYSLLPEYKRRQMIRQIVAHGGIVTYDESLPGIWKSEKLTRIDNPPELSKEWMMKLRQFEHLKQVSIGNVATDSGIPGDVLVPLP